MKQGTPAKAGDRNCIFCKIASGEISVTPIYEDAQFLAFHDQNAQAPIHALVIPKTHLETLLDLHDPALITGAFLALQKTAEVLRLTEEGFRTVINCRENGGQTVYHLHFHLLGGRFMGWPPG